MPDTPEHKEEVQENLSVQDGNQLDDNLSDVEEEKQPGGIVPLGASTDQYNEAYRKLHPVEAAAPGADPSIDPEEPSGPRLYARKFVGGADLLIDSVVRSGIALGPELANKARRNIRIAVKSALTTDLPFAQANITELLRGKDFEAPDTEKEDVFPQETIDTIRGPHRKTKTAEIINELTQFVAIFELLVFALPATIPVVAATSVRVAASLPKKLRLIPSILTEITGVSSKAFATKFLMFEPYIDKSEGLLQGLMANVPGLRVLSDAMEVQEDDGPLLQKARAGLSEFMDFAAIGGAIIGFRHAGALKAFFRAEGDLPAQARALAQIEKTGVELEQIIAKSKHVPEDAVRVIKTPEGAQIVPNTEAAQGKRVLQEAVREEGKEAVTGANHGDAFLKAGSPAKFEEGYVLEDGTFLDRAATEAHMKETGQKLGDARVESSITSPEIDAAITEPGEVALTAKEQKTAIEDILQYEGENAVVEASGQSATINNLVREAATQNVGGELTLEQSKQVIAFAQNLVKAAKEGDKQAIQQLVDGTHFNFSSFNEADEVLALIEGLSFKFAAEIEEAMKIGGITVEETIDQVRRAMRGMTDAEAPAAVLAKLKSFDAQSVWLLWADVVMKEYGKKIVRISKVLEMRPHDGPAHEMARKYISTMFAISRRLAGANSETGRALRLMQERGQVELGKLQFAQKAKAVAERADVAREVVAKDVAKAEVAVKAGEQELAVVRREQAAARAKPEKTGTGLTEQEEAFAKILQDKVKANKSLVKSLKAQKVRAKKAGVTADKADAARKQAVADEGGETIAGMSFTKIRAISTLFRMSRGDPLAVHAVARGTGIILKDGMWNKVLELFLNNLLSGPVTWGIVATSGAITSIAEPIMKVAAGAATFDRELITEGADILVGLHRFSKDGWRAFQATMRAGHNITRGVPTTQAIGGTTGEVVRIPGRIMASFDEAIFVPNYRSFVWAKARRIGRADGLSGRALDKFADNVVKESFDPVTGIARLAEGIQYAERPLFASPLEKFSSSGKFSQLVIDFPALKIIAPFIRSSVNLMRYSSEATPLVNRYSARVRAALKEGGDEARMIHAREAVTTMVLGTGWVMHANGNLTGRGPADPGLRRVWLLTHDPYSFRGSNDRPWHGFSRFEPWSIPLMIMADVFDMIDELVPDFQGGEHSPRDVQEIIGSFMVGMATSFTNKIWLEGVTDFMSAWSENNAPAAVRWMEGMARNFIPGSSAFRSLNPDPYFREAFGLVETLIKDVPGFSKTLSPRYNIYGEPELKANFLSRALLPSKTNPNKKPDPVAEAMEAIRSGFTEVPDKLLDAINLRDSMWKDTDGQKRPWDRLNEIIREGPAGGPSMREALTTMVESSQFESAGAGSLLFPGGIKYKLIAATKHKIEAKAVKQLMDEYPKIKAAFIELKKARGDALRGTAEDEGRGTLQDIFDKVK